jgi:plastocyanin
MFRRNRMRNKRVFEAAAALAAILGGVLAAAPALGDARAPEATSALTKRIVVMDNFFEPRYVTIHKGDKVVWTWKGDNPHNVTFIKVPKNASKKGADTRREGRWSRRFRKRGFYKYVCTIHSGMRGSIEVRSAPPPVAQ